MAEPHQARPPGSARDDPRSTMARVSDTRPFTAYDPARAHQEPPAVIAARKRHRALNEAMAERLRELEARQPGDPP